MDSHTRNRLSTVRQQGLLTLKELRETLRDRRTIITLLAMPLLLYPLLGLTFRYLAVQNLPAGETEYRIALASEPEANWLQEVLRRGDQLVSRESAGENAAPRDADNLLQFYAPEAGQSFDLPGLIGAGEAELGVRIAFREQIIDGNLPGADVELLVREGSLVSREAADHVRTRLQALNLASVLQQSNAEQPGKILAPLSEKSESIAATGKPTALLGMLPLVLLLMTVTGGVYPAIDLTAGERERHTLETLMALPVSPFRLLAAKYVAVVAVILLTGLMNLLAMSVTMYALQLETSLFGPDGLTVGLLVRLCGILFVFAAFYASVLLLVTCSARSFKEAQAFLIPLLLLSLAPGLVISLPGWTLNPVTAILPLVNMLLLAREVLEGTAQAATALLALAVTLGYGAGVLLLAGRLFGKDAVALGSRDNWAELFSRPVTVQPRPSVTLATATLCGLFPVYFVVSGMLTRLSTESLALRLTLSGVLTAGLFAGIPLLLLAFYRIRLVSGLSLQPVRRAIWPGVVLLGLGTWPWIFEMVIWLEALNLGGIREEHFSQVAQLLNAWRAIPVWQILLVLGLLPGVCEELFFRGFLLNGLRSRWSVAGSIILSALAFGLFHVVIAGGLAPQRVIPSTCMGLLLGWVAWQAGSILPTMLLHVIHNSTLLLLARQQEQLSGWMGGLGPAEHLPAGWLLLAGGAFLTGTILIYWTSRQSSAARLQPAE